LVIFDQDVPLPIKDDHFALFGKAGDLIDPALKECYAAA
jgi:hypothetical protein